MTTRDVATIEHAGMLEDKDGLPGYLSEGGVAARGLYSCSFCGVGDSGVLAFVSEATPGAAVPGGGQGILRLSIDARTLELPATLTGQELSVRTATPVTAAPEGAGTIRGELIIGGRATPVSARETGRTRDDGGGLVAQRFALFARAGSITDLNVTGTVPTTGCVKLKLSMGQQRPAFPIHVEPSVLDRATGQRRPVSYEEGIRAFADLLLEHRPPRGRTLCYACGQLDYFSIFAVQEVFRLLGVRNLTGNAEHCLNAGAVHVEVLTGQEAPCLTIAQALEGPDRFYLFNGWNGFITHPPVFKALLKREDLDAFLVEVAVTESAKELARRLGPERVLLIRPRGDPHLALGVAHEILMHYPIAVEQRFVSYFADGESYRRFSELARSERFAADRVAERLAPEPAYVDRLAKGIRMIALKLARPATVPINIPSVGLSQTSGIVAHCLWGNVLGMLGKFGLHADGSPAGGTLRVPGQINAETEVQGLSRKYFMGRILMHDAPEAARRMGLPDDAYELVAREPMRAALDYSEPAPDSRELFVCMGTQFESNMMERERWVRKLTDPSTRLVVIDPIPDPFSIRHADLILPSPPHAATTKVYQNGEWKMSLSVPLKRAAAATRSDPTLLYDAMAEVGRRLESEPALAQAHPDLARHVASGYLRERFADPGLPRVDGEVSRPHLWRRIQQYMSGGRGPLYCRPEHADGRPIEWRELLEHGAIIYGGVGVRRFRLDYDHPDRLPFADIYRTPRRWSFFVPTEDDLKMPQGVIMTSGRSSLSDEPKRVRFAIASFNSGKATPTVDMPDENPVYVSPSLAARMGLATGDRARVTGRHSGGHVVLPVVVTDRAKGDTVYVSFHKSRAEIDEGRYVNAVTSHEGRCPYCAQTSVKATQVIVEKAGAPAQAQASARVSAELPVWSGQSTPLDVADIVQETADVFTFRFQGDPPCRFVYHPGQYCSLVLSIGGKKVVRSYTISSSPSRPYQLEITVKRVPGGLVSNWLPDNLKVGSRVEIAGPKGKFCLVSERLPRKVLLIGAGSGVTPMLSMARWLTDTSAPVDIRFFNSVRSPADIIGRTEIELMSQRNKLFAPVIVTSTRGAQGSWTGFSGRINRAMLQMAAPDLRERQVYVCGPEGFMTCVKDLLGQMEFDLANLHLESFGGVRASVADMPAPVGVAGADGSPARAGSLAVEFARTGKVAHTDGATTLLDLAEENDVSLDYGCRSGNCGDCKVKLLAGDVAMPAQSALSAEERAAGYVLSCVARPRSRCAVDA